jgi:hypothetical protein
VIALDAPELLRRDVHPADVVIGEHVIGGVRVFITDRRLVAFSASEGSIEVALDVALEQPCSVPASRETLGHGRLEARLADGRTAWVNRGQGCGCHSPLKALAAPVPWSAR